MLSRINWVKRGYKAFERRLAALRTLAAEGGEVDVSWVYAASGANSTDLRYLEKTRVDPFQPPGSFP